MEASSNQYRVSSMRKDSEKHQQTKIQKFINTLPKKFRDKYFSDYEAISPQQRRVKLFAEKFVSTAASHIEEGAVLRFLGNPGTGKTLLSLIMCQALVRRGFTTHYEPSLQFLQVLLEKRNRSMAVYQSLVDYYSRIEFLVLDGKNEFLSESEKNILQCILNKRYQQKNGSTLIIGNHNLSELTNFTLTFNWHSYRQK